MYILIDLISEVYFPFMKSFEVDCAFFYFWVQKLHIRIFNQYQLFYLPANKNLWYCFTESSAGKLHYYISPDSGSNEVSRASGCSAAIKMWLTDKTTKL